IYQDVPLMQSIDQLALDLIQLMQLESVQHKPEQYQNHWNQQDAIVISYGDSLLNPPEKPLSTLKHFLDTHTAGCINSVHILPFFPYSSDDGFSVMDFSSVNEALGEWSDIQTIADDYR